MPQVFYILFGAVFTVCVSWSLGRLFLQRTGVELYREEEHLFGFCTGSALLSLFVFILCTLGFARKSVFLWTGIAVFVAVWRSKAYRGAGASLNPIPRNWKIVFPAIFSVYGLVYLCNAMAPEISPDGSTYHLGLVLRYLRWHGFHTITTNMYANLSQGAEMLFLFAFAFGRHSSAALVHCAFLLMLPWLILTYARRFGFVRAGVCGALLVFVSPIFGIDGISAYNDVAVACVVFSLFYLLQIWLAERQDRLLVLAGLMAGFAYAIKYTAFVALPYALAVVAWKSWRERRPGWRNMLAVAGWATLMMAPWIAKNWISVGNPVSPFLNSIFPNPFVHVSFEKEYAEYFRNYGLSSLWTVPYLVTVKGALGGMVGPVFLLAPLALIALRLTAGRHLLLAAAVFGSPYFANIGARFLIPVVPFIALSLGLVMEFSPALIVVLLLVHAGISWPGAIRFYSASAGCWNLSGLPVRAALRLSPEEDFLGKRLGIYGIARMVDRFVPPDGRVLSFDPVAEAYTTRNVMVAYQSAEGNLEQDMLLTPSIEEFQPTWRLEFRFPSTRLRALRVVQTASRAPDLWSVSEVRLFQNGAELPRRAKWRMRAQPFPWDVTLAFDNSPVTRWRSWQALYAGMFIEVDFGTAETVDRALLEASHDQYKIDLHLDGKDEAGVWHRLAGPPAYSDSAPLANLRRTATTELKARGTSYLLIEDSHRFAKDFRLNRRLWGLTPLGEWSGARLYRID